MCVSQMRYPQSPGSYRKWLTMSEQLTEKRSEFVAALSDNAQLLGVRNFALYQKSTI